MTLIRTLSDDSLAALKRDHERLRYEVEQLRTMLRSFMSTCQPRAATLWRATLNEAFGATTAHYAAADLLGINGMDTGRDIQLYDPLDVFSALAGIEGLYVFEQLGSDGKTYWMAMQSPCPEPD